MARISRNLSWLIGGFGLAALLAAPAAAQFFGQPPRPPADVPNAPPPNYSDQPPQQRPYQQPAYPQPTYQQPGAAQQRVYQGPRPPAEIHSDVPPARPLPAPMSLPPSGRPGGGNIQSQPLAPLPGTATPPGQANVPRQQPGVARPPGAAAPQQPATADTAPQPGDEVVVAPPPQRINNPTAVFAGLDKISGRITKFDVAIDETVQFGALQVTPRACYSRPPTETPQTDSFVEVDEVTLKGEIKRIFTGWMFAASPGLHAVEHPIYDVWLTDCKGGKGPAVAEVPDEPQAAAKPPARAPTPPRRPQRQIR
jgi:hypothetical protein